MQINFSLDKETLQFKKTIKQIFETAISITNVSSNISVNVALVTDDEIRKLNATHRGIDKVTDVLSFPMIENIDEIENEADFFTGACNVGDIYINLNRAKEQACEYGHSLKREFCFLALHGFLHLLGFDHMEKNDEILMLEVQDKVLEIVNLGRN